MSYSKTDTIATLLAAKRTELRTSYLYVLFAYDEMGIKSSHNTKDVARLLGDDLDNTRVSVSRLHKMGYLDKITKGVFKTTPKWSSARLDINRMKTKLNNRLTEWKKTD
jgi:predicted transcriptional regulator of viral defense system